MSCSVCGRTYDLAADSACYAAALRAPEAMTVAFYRAFHAFAEDGCSAIDMPHRRGSGPNSDAVVGTSLSPTLAESGDEKKTGALSVGMPQRSG